MRSAQAATHDGARTAGSIGLPIIQVGAASHSPTAADRRGRDRDRLIRQAKQLSWLSLGWMGVEAGVGIAAATAAGSVALLGFGIDSVIEALASVIVIWRFSARRRLSERAELQAQRLVAVSFCLLAPYIAADAIRSLLVGARPSTSWLGIGLALSSLVAMPALAHAKRRVGTQLGSGAVTGEGAQNSLCAYLAAAVLVGLVLNAAAGLWWADPAVSLAIAAVALNEGRETWSGADCCASAVPPATKAATAGAPEPGCCQSR